MIFNRNQSIFNCVFHKTVMYLLIMVGLQWKSSFGRGVYLYHVMILSCSQVPLQLLVCVPASVITPIGLTCLPLYLNLFLLSGCAGIGLRAHSQWDSPVDWVRMGGAC